MGAELKEVHFLASKEFVPNVSESLAPKKCNLCEDFVSTEYHLDRRDMEECLITTQMCFLADAGTMMAEGMKVYIHDLTGDYEIKLGKHNDRTDRSIRSCQNIYKLWIGREFDK